MGEPRPRAEIFCIFLATINVKKDQRGVMATRTAAAGAKCQITEAEMDACSIDAMLNGGTCEA